MTIIRPFLQNPFIQKSTESQAKQPVSLKELRLQRLSKRLSSAWGLPIINSIDKGGLLPPLFRMSGALPIKPCANINIEGLQNLRLSGSSQFSEFSLKTLLNRIKAIEGKQTHVTIINLKQEDGLFAFPKRGEGAISFSYLKPLPWWVGPNRTAEQIAQSEEQKAHRLRQKQLISIYGVVDSIDAKTLTKDHHTVTTKLTIRPKEVMTEQQLVEREGCSYVRIPDRKFGNMEWEHIDALVSLVKQLPPNEHVHFHCRRGASRTTLFMVMYDMMRNGTKATANDIISRHGSLGLGGTDLMKLPEPTTWEYPFKSGWLQFLHHFHTYVTMNSATNFEKSWSAWAKEQQIPEPKQIHLDETYPGASLDSTLPQYGESARMKERPLILNALNESKVMVQNFRSTQGFWPDLTNNPQFKPDGLRNVYASGSSQYSKIGLELMLKKIKEQDPQAHVFVWDLQHYDHLFINGHDVSAFETNQEFIKDRTAEEITRSEEALKQQLLQKPGVKLRAIDTQYPKDSYEKRFSLRLQPKDVETPQELVTKAGATYILIPTKRFKEISDDEIDHLVDYTRTLPEHAWTHFHCKMGKSRTTLYLTLFDMLHNADKLPLEDIVRRQKLIGGIDLFDITPQDPTWEYEKKGKRDRVILLARFHEYVRTMYIPAVKAQQIPTTWSEWSKAQPDTQPINLSKVIKEV